KGVGYLFDIEKPHFEAWRTLYDIDTPTFSSTFFSMSRKSAAAPLYYATLCGFHDLVEHLIIKYPEDVNASGGSYVRPLVAALAKKHFRTAELLRHSGADLHCHGGEMMAPLHLAAEIGDVEVVQKLIEYGADINAGDSHGCTPLHIASEGSGLKDGSVHRLLLEHGADVNARKANGSTPLHHASFTGVLDVVRLLLEQGADVEAEDNRGRTALRIAEEYEIMEAREEVKKLLLEHKAK
ncbi:ankyrin repeat-containing domain protein, partial [Russula vinacea]